MKDYFIVVFDECNNGNTLKHFSDLKECINYFRRYCIDTASVHYVILQSVDISKYFVLYD